MMRLNRHMLRWISIGLLAITLLACGGGGGGGDSSDTTRTLDYTGSTEMATLTQDNAELLAIESYSGSFAGPADARSSLSQSTLPPKAVDTYQGRILFHTIKESMQRVDFGSAGRSNSTASSTQQTGTSYGPCGGSLDMSFNIDETTGNFSGTFNYNGYCDDSATVTGRGQLEGVLDQDSDQLQRLRMSFGALDVTETGGAYTLSGWIELLDNTDGSETLRMDVLMQDGTSGKICWLYNYAITAKAAGSYTDVTISGRYYHPDYGYVDLQTETPVRFSAYSDWPLQGALVVTGRDGAWVRVSFSATGYCRLEADFDDDDSTDWMQDHWFITAPDNQAPVANAGNDRTAAVDSLVKLDGSASYDPDNDAIGYRWSFVSCPSGGCPALTTPFSPTVGFQPTAIGQYILQLIVNDGQLDSPADRVLIEVFEYQPTQPDLFSQEWKFGIFGTYIGSSGFNAVDLDNDGVVEIIAGASVSGFGSNTMWYVIRHTGPGDYQRVWYSPPYDNAIMRILTADTDADGVYEIYVGLADGTIHIYNGLTYAHIGTLETGAGLSAMAIGDTNSDRTPEIVCSDGSDLRIYASGDHQLVWASTNWGGQSLAIGNVDDDTSPEIVATTSNGHGYVVNGADHSLQWDYINGFGKLVALGDIDSDGRQEIIGSAAWDKITIFQAEIKTPSDEIPTDLDIAALRVADVDGDQIPEILYGDGQWGAIHCYDGGSLEERWSITNPEHGVTDIAMGDVDADGVLEVLWGAGGTSTGEDHLYIADAGSQTIEWHNIHIDGPLSALDVGDVDDDGQDEIVMVSYQSNSSYDDGVIHIFDARTHALEWRLTDLPQIDTWCGVNSVKIGDVDGDGDTEFVLATADLYDGLIQIYNGSTHVLERSSSPTTGASFTKLALADVDGDGQMEIVVGQQREHTGATGTHIVVFDGATAQQEWQSVSLTSSWGAVNDIVVDDVDNDGNPEIIVSVAKSQVYAFDGVTHQMDWLQAIPAYALAVDDIDADGQLEILVGQTTGEIAVYDGANFSLKSSLYPAAPRPVMALLVDDLDSDGQKEIIIASNQKLMVYDASVSELLWQSGMLGVDLGRYNHLVARDQNADGHKELFIGSYIALYQF